MRQRLTWLRTECGTGKTCAGMARHSGRPGEAILRGYTITDPTVLDDLGPAPAGEAYVYVPDDVLNET